MSDEQFVVQGGQLKLLFGEALLVWKKLVDRGSFSFSECAVELRLALPFKILRNSLDLTRLTDNFLRQMKRTGRVEFDHDERKWKVIG